MPGRIDVVRNLHNRLNDRGSCGFGLHPQGSPYVGAFKSLVDGQVTPFLLRDNAQAGLDCWLAALE
jgi:hypothetical protein